MVEHPFYELRKTVQLDLCGWLQEAVDALEEGDKAMLEDALEAAEAAARRSCDLLHALAYPDQQQVPDGENRYFDENLGCEVSEPAYRDELGTPWEPGQVARKAFPRCWPLHDFPIR